MLWSAFVDAVESHLAVEANRRGLESFRSRYMRNAVLDLQRYIRGYRSANKTTYQVANATTESQAQLFTLPSGAKPKSLWLYSTDADYEPLCARYRLAFYPWNARQDLICGRLNFSTWLGCCCNTVGCPPASLSDDEQQAYFSKAYVYTMSPMGRNFLIYPQITASTSLLLIWDGYLYNPADGDTVNFPEEASEAVAAYVQAKIARNVDKNIPLSVEFEKDWMRLRLSLFRDFRETQDDLGAQPDEEYGATVVAP